MIATAENMEPSIRLNGRNNKFLNICYTKVVLESIKKYSSIFLIIIHVQNPRTFFFTNILFLYNSSIFFFFVKGNFYFT